MAAPINENSFTVDYVLVRNGEPCPAINSDEPFVAIVYAEVRCEVDLQWDVSRKLVDAGCLSMLALGYDCSSWDDSVDDANLQDFDYGPIPDEKFVMTSWYEGEPFSEVFWETKYNLVTYCDLVLTHALIIHVGLKDRSQYLRSVFNQVKS